MQKTEFAPKEKGLGVDWEYKFKYERDGKMASFLGAANKAEIEGEYLPKVGLGNTFRLSALRTASPSSA